MEGRCLPDRPMGQSVRACDRVSNLNMQMTGGFSNGGSNVNISASWLKKGDNGCVMVAEKIQRQHRSAGGLTET